MKSKNLFQPTQPFNASFNRKKISRAMVPACTVALIISQSVALAGNTWTGGGASNNWSDANNWGGLAPAYGTLTFTTGGTQGTTSNNNSITAMNRLLWTGSSSWIMNGSSTLSLFDFGGTQAKIENQSTGLVTINAPITFAANNGAPPNPFGEINAVNGDITFGTGTLTVNGSSVNGIKLFGSGRTTTFNNTVSASGKWFGLTGANTTMAVGGAFTSGDIYVMNSGTLKINSGGTVTSSAIRLGGDFGNTGNQNQTLGGTLQFTSLTGGQTFSSVINTVTGNTSNALLIDSLNTSGTNTLSAASFLDSDLKVQVASGGTLSFTGGSIDVKIRKLTVAGAGTTIINEPLTSSFGAGGLLVKEGAGTLILQGTSNTYTGTNNLTLNANGTAINAGTLGIYGDGSLGLAPAGAYNNIQFTGSATLQNTANNISLNVNRNISIASGATASFDSNGNTFTVNGVVNGTGGALTKIGAGTLVLSNTSINTYTGATTVTTGTLQLDGSTHASSTVGIGTAGTLSGTGTVNGNATLTGNGVINKASGTIAGTLNVTGGNWNGAGAVSGLVTSSSGLFTIGNGANLTANGNLNVTGGTIAAGNSTSTITGSVNYTSSSNSTFAGVIAGSGKTLTVNNASATLILSGTNTYSGITSVSAGTLLVNGTNSGSGAVNVTSGATLGGSGSLAGSVNVSGTLAPGTSIESIGTGAVNFIAGSTFAYELNSASLNGDLVYSTSTLDIAAGTILSLTQLASGTLTNGSKLTLISYFGGWTIGEEFTYLGNTLDDGETFTLGANQWLFNYDDLTGGSNYATDQATGVNARFVTMMVVPEPSAALLGGLGAVLLLRRRRF